MNTEKITLDNGEYITVHPATLDSVGDWEGQEDAAISAWNRIVFPAMVKYASECTEEADYAHYAQRVWDKFATEGGDDMDERATSALVVA